VRALPDLFHKRAGAVAKRTCCAQCIVTSCGGDWGGTEPLRVEDYEGTAVSTNTALAPLPWMAEKGLFTIEGNVLNVFRRSANDSVGGGRLKCSAARTFARLSGVE